MPDILFETPIGPLFAVASAHGLQRLEFVRGAASLGHRELAPDDGDSAQRILALTRRQIDEYFAGERREFSLPLEPQGSPFQLRVWEAIASIPYGEVMSYGDVAFAAGSPGAFRAAGSACGANRLTLVIPCHRVVGANRVIGGYGGGLDIKRRLLTLEGSLAGLRDSAGR